MISIIIPVLNPNSFLFRCLDSIIQQTFSNWEVIILDGGYSIVVDEYLLKIGDSRIKLFREADKGVYSAMNKGIFYSKGNWLYFIGSDDFLYNDFVLSGIWNQLSNTDLPVVYGNVLIDGDTGWAKDGQIYAGYFSKNRMLKKAICHQAIFYKKEFLLYNNLTFNLKYFVSADWDLNLRCRRISRFKYVELIIAVFKAGGISSIKRDSFPDEIEFEFSDLFPSRFEIFIKNIGKKVFSFVK